MHDDRRTPPRRDLTPELLEQLLARLAAGRTDAGEGYNRTRARLIQFFVWKRCDAAEDLADEVINRVARRLGEGEEIPNLAGYFLGVARLVALEANQRRVREDRVLAQYSLRASQTQSSSEEDAAFNCLEGCLGRLTDGRREQLLAYYTGDQSARIEQRRKLAAELGVGPVALRNRMLRMRQSLETCIDQCLSRVRSDRLAETDTLKRVTSPMHPGDERA